MLKMKMKFQIRKLEEVKIKFLKLFKNIFYNSKIIKWSRALKIDVPPN